VVRYRRDQGRDRRRDASALKELRAISAETGISQQELIAEGLNYVLTKCRKRSVAR
jgi:hypothetical protein